MSIRERSDSNPASRIRFRAALHRPKVTGQPADWTFLTLPKEASGKLPSRGQTTVEGTLNGRPMRATLEPDGQGGHWLNVSRDIWLARSLGAGQAEGAPACSGRVHETPLKPGDVVTLDVAPVAEEPEPKVPPDLRKALTAAPPRAREVWSDITPAARRDFIHWITSPKRPETRARRIATACDMLAKGKRRPCCFDRSGMYSKSLSCPAADDEPDDASR